MILKKFFQNIRKGKCRVLSKDDYTYILYDEETKNFLTLYVDAKNGIVKLLTEKSKIVGLLEEYLYFIISFDKIKKIILDFVIKKRNKK